MSKGSKKINENVVPTLAKVAVKEFEKSLDNINCSVMNLYRGGLMSKAKYNSALSSLMYKTGVDSKKAPYHSSSLFSAFRVGLGVNTMQGKEAKYQKLATYAEFSLPKDRWEKVFLHEHMSLIWLRQQNPHLVKYSKSKLQYIPKRCCTREICFCGLPKQQDETGLKYCQSPLMAEISACVAARKITIRMRRILE